MANETAQKRDHLFEIDFVRTITVFSVVALHSFVFTKVLLSSNSQTTFVSLIGHALNYNREMFMFITGLVLTYVYYNRDFSIFTFWKKRLLVIFIPYVLWTIVYMVANNPPVSMIPMKYISLFAYNLATGNASFQLYYIMLALEFYFIFPFFKIILKKLAAYPLLVLTVSLAIQLLTMYIDHNYFQNTSFHAPSFLQPFIIYRDKIILTYQFFFIFGAFAALNLTKIYEWFKKFGKYIPVAFLLSFCLYYWYSASEVIRSIDYASTVLQPSVVLYTITAIIFFMYLSTLWVKKRKGFKLIKIISDTSFGVFFVHILVLSYTSTYLLPILPSFIPIPIQMILVILLAFSISVICCFGLLRTRFLSWTIGKIGK
jgi:hypothetical protein